MQTVKRSTCTKNGSSVITVKPQTNSLILTFAKFYVAIHVIKV